MPFIFASSIITLPQMVLAAFKDNRVIGPVLDWLKFGEPLYTLLYALGIIFFAYFYISIVFNPNDVADNMRKHGGLLPRILAREPNGEFFNTRLRWITPPWVP